MSLVFECSYCGFEEEVYERASFCPSCGSVAGNSLKGVSKGRSEPLGSEATTVHATPLLNALSTLHESLGLAPDQLSGLSAARTKEYNSRTNKSQIERATLVSRRCREKPFQHPVAWRPMGRVRPPPPNVLVASSEPPIKHYFREPKFGSSSRQKQKRLEATKNKRERIPSPSGPPAIKATRSEDIHEEWKTAQEMALATGGFRHGNIVFAPVGWETRAAEAAALARLEAEMREQKAMMEADAEALAYKLEESKDFIETLLTRSSPGRHQILSRALNVGSDAVAILVAIQIADDEEWFLEVEAYSIRNSESGTLSPTNEPELIFILRLSASEAIAMVKDQKTVVNPLRVDFDSSAERKDIEDMCISFVNRVTPQLISHIANGQPVIRTLALNHNGAYTIGATFDRTIFRCSTRVPWGPLWKRRLCPMLLSVSLLDDTGRLEINAVSLLRRIPPRFKVEADWEKCTCLLLNPRPFSEIAINGHTKVVCYEICCKLKLENTSYGPVLVFVGDEVRRAKPFPEDVSESEASNSLALILQRITRGIYGRTMAQRKRIQVEVEKRAREDAERSLERSRLETAKRIQREKEEKKSLELARQQEKARAEAIRKHEEARRKLDMEEHQRREAELERHMEEEEEALQAIIRERQKKDEEQRRLEMERKREEAELRNAGILVGERVLQGTTVWLRVQVQPTDQVSVSATDKETGRIASANFDKEDLKLRAPLCIPPNLSTFDDVSESIDLFYSKKMDVMVLAAKRK